MLPENKSYIRAAKGKILLGLLAASMMATGPSLALDKAKNDPQIQHRHNVKEIVKYSLKGMSAILKGEVKSPDHFPALAQAMASSASIATDMFKTDTRGIDGKTDAVDKIWDNWEDFSKRMDAFNADAQDLAMVAKEGDMKKNILAFKKTAKNCKSCHDEYKKDRKK